MVFPLGDVIPSRTTPWITFALIGANALVFLYELLLSDASLTRFVLTVGLVPHALSFPWLDAITAMFVHSDWLRIVANLLALWIFGPTIEDRMGHARFIVFYLAAGMVAALAHTWAVPNSTVPLVGAGGALAAVMGAYVVLFPYSRVLVLIVFVDIVEIPAFLFIGLWLLSQLSGGAGRVTDIALNSVPLWAYAGGIATGVLGVRLFRRRERDRVEWWS